MADGDRRAARDRAQATGRGDPLRIAPDDVGGAGRYSDSGRKEPLVIAHTTHNGTVIAEPVVDALVAEIKARQIDVIVVDPFVSCHNSPENDNQAQGMIIKEWGRVADWARLSHPLGRPYQEDGPGRRSDDRKRPRCQGQNRCLTRRPRHPKGRKPELKTIGFFRAYIDKGNMAPPLDKSDWYNLVGVDLGNGNLGGPGDDVGVVTAWKWPDHTANITGADFDRVALVIRRGKWREDIRATDWAGVAIAEALGLDIKTKAHKSKAGSLLKFWLKTGAFIVVEGYDDNRELRKFIELSEGQNG
jgi:hypothetical protein